MIDDRMIEAEIPHLRRYARALLRGEQEAADDLVQDTLERAWRKRNLWRPSGRLRSWLFRILYRCYLDRRPSPRRQASQKLIRLDDAQHELPSIQGQQETALHLQDLLQAIDRLPETQRAILLLVALEQPSYRDGARMLGIQVGTFRSRLSRAREYLSEQLATQQNTSDRRNSDEHTTLRNN